MPFSHDTFAGVVIALFVVVGGLLAFAIEKMAPAETRLWMRSRVRLVILPFGMAGAAVAIYGYDPLQSAYWVRYSACTHLITTEEVEALTGREVGGRDAHQWSDTCDASWKGVGGEYPPRLAYVRVDAVPSRGTNRWLRALQEERNYASELPTTVTAEGHEVHVFRNRSGHLHALISAGDGGHVVVQVEDEDLDPALFDEELRTVLSRLAVAEPVLRRQGRR